MQTFVRDAVKKYMSDKKMNLKDVERECGVKYSTLRDLLKKESFDELSMGVGTVFKIANMLEMSVEELYKKAAPSLADDERGLIEKYREMNEFGQSSAHAMVCGLLYDDKYKKDNSTELDEKQA